MLNSYSNTIEYLSVKEVAEFTGAKLRTLRDRCVKNKYICRVASQAHGGKQYEILVSSLEVELQEKIYKVLNSSTYMRGNTIIAEDRLLTKAPLSLDSKHNLYTQNGGSPETICNTNNISPLSLKKISIGESLQNLQGDKNENISLFLDCSNYDIIPLSFDKNAVIELKNSIHTPNHINTDSLDKGAVIELFKNTAPVQPVNENIPEKAKNIALAKLDLLNHWQAYRNGQKDKKQADKDFLEMYNSKVLSLKLFSTIGNVSKATLYRWNKDYKDVGNYTALIPNYNYGNDVEIQTSISMIEQKALLDLMLRPNKMQLSKAWDIIRYLFDKKGMSVASESAYRRFINKYKKNNYDVWVMMREGRKSLLDKVAPYVIRQPELLNVGDVLVADGNVLDFMVINPFTGKPCRATLVVYMDWKSWDIAGYEIMITENTQCIASALRNSIIRLGKIPKICYQDNGRAFRGKFFTGTDSLEECGIYGLFGRLNIVPCFAKPYNGKAKIVERFFKEFTSSFSKLMESYIGNNIDNKPAYLKRAEDFHKALHSDYIPTIEETKEYIELWLDFHRSHVCPNDKTKTIGQVFEEGKGDGVDIDILDDLMMMSEERLVQRNGIRLFGAWYNSPELYGIKDKVVAKYSLLDISKVKIYRKTGEFVCTAHTIMAIHPQAERLGDAKDVFALKQALKAQSNAVKLTMKKVKSISTERFGNNVKFIEQKHKTEEKKTVIQNKVYELPSFDKEISSKKYNPLDNYGG